MREIAADAHLISVSTADVFELEVLDLKLTRRLTHSRIASTRLCPCGRLPNSLFASLYNRSDWQYRLGYM